MLQDEIMTKEILNSVYEIQVKKSINGYNFNYRKKWTSQKKQYVFIGNEGLYYTNFIKENPILKN